MEKMKQLWKELIEPPEEFTPVPFWFFNDEPDEERIRGQLEDFVEKGVHAFVLHPRIGIPERISYLSPEYFKVIRFIVKTASELGMRVVLYDEGMYPSGSAHGMVVEENPEFASKGITLAEEIGDREVIAKLPGERYLVYGFTQGTIRGIHFGEDDGEEKAPKSADILNPEAVRAFIRLTHDKYYEELKEYFGTTVYGFFTDEPCALGRNASGYREWVPGLKEEIEAAGGEIIELVALFEGSENKTTRIYRKLMKYHLRETFYKPLSDWCMEHGIVLMGHPAESDDIEEELYFHVPGQDLIFRRVVPMTGGLTGVDSVQAKLTADIARILGRRRNMNECFGVCNRDGIPWYFTGGDMKWYIDWLGIRGVNLFVPHAFYYSVAGKRKDERPPDVGPNNIWWLYYRHFSDYMKRLSWLMTDSKDCVSVAVLCDNNNVPAKAVEKLYKNQIGFHYLPVSMAETGRAQEGKFYIGDCCYEIILNVLGEEYKDLSVFCGVMEVDSEDEILKLAEQEAYKRWKTIAAKPVADDLRAVHRIKEDCDLILLSNEGKHSIRAKLSVKDIENPIWVDLWEGTVYECTYIKEGEDRDWIEMELSPYETVLILSDQNKDLGDIIKRRVKPEDWTERFELSRQEKNKRVYRYTINMDKANTSIYDCTVCTDRRMLMPEYIQVSGEEMAECRCNGERIGISFWSPHTFQIGGKWKEGRNDIEIIMTGNAANLYGETEISFGLADKMESFDNASKS